MLFSPPLTLYDLILRKINTFYMYASFVQREPHLKSFSHFWTKVIWSKLMFLMKVVVKYDKLHLFTFVMLGLNSRFLAHLPLVCIKAQVLQFYLYQKFHCCLDNSITLQKEVNYYE